MMAFACHYSQDLPSDKQPRRTSDQGSHTRLGSTAGFPRLTGAFLPILFDALLDFLQVYSCTVNSNNAQFPPLNDVQFEELCTAVYYELVRRGGVKSDRQLWEFLDWPREQNSPQEKRAGGFHTLAWLPTNLFGGLARDICFELCNRFPWIAQHSFESGTPYFSFSRLPHHEVSSAEEDIKMTNIQTDTILDIVHFDQPHPFSNLQSVPIYHQEPRLCNRPSPRTWSNLNSIGTILPGQYVPTGPDQRHAPLDIIDALAYLDSIKNRFQSQPSVYDEFLGVMSAFQHQRVNMALLSHRVSMIFINNPALIEGFFLPPAYSVEDLLELSDVSPSRPHGHARTAKVEFSKLSGIQSSPTQKDAATKSPSRRPSLEPFFNDSPLCLDGQITRLSEYAVASGGYADIWMGYCASQTVAIKIMRAFSSIGTPIQRPKLLKRLWREYLAWSRLRHENILECLGFSYDFTPQAEYEIPSLISPWMSNGTVLSYIENHPSVDRSNLLVGIAAGLSYLHSREPPIIHGDLRAGNILVSNTGIPCLTDFGLSRILSDTRGMTTSSEPAGSVRWMSPELLHNDKTGESSDIWAYGMTVLEILSGKRPYHEFNLEPVVLRQIIEGKVPSRPTGDHFMTDEFWDLCQECWQLQPSQRPSMSDVLIKMQIA